MTAGRTRLMWATFALGVTAMAAVACGGSTAPETPVPEPATVVATQDAGHAQEASGQAYADEVLAISESSDAETRELFEGPPGPAGELALLAEALPKLIERATADIAALEALDVPEEYTADQEYAIAFLREQIARR